MADIISETLALDDGALSKKLGLDSKVSTFRKDLERADKLSGDARDKAVKSLTDIFAPNTYAVSDFGYQVDRAEKKKLSGPAAVVDCCCDVAEED